MKYSFKILKFLYEVFMNLTINVAEGVLLIIVTSIVPKSLLRPSSEVHKEKGLIGLSVDRYSGCQQMD